MNRVRSRRILGPLTLLVISLAIPLFLAEIILRQVFPIGTGRPFLYHRIPHPVFGWSLEPDASYRYRMSGTTVRVTYNSEGWRDIEHNFENRLGLVRVLVLGDSYMEAYSVELDDAFPRRIEQFASENGFDIEVLNLGVGGYGTLQEYLVFREVGKLYKPNLVLLGFYMGNDVTNNSIQLESILNVGSMKVETRPFLDSADPTTWKITMIDFEGAQRRYSEAKVRQNSWLRKLARQSALLRTLYGVAVSTVRRHLTTDQPQWSPTDRESMYLALLGPNYCQEPPEYTKVWVTTKRILARLKHDVETIGSTLLVFTVPAFHEADFAVMEKLTENAPNPAAICLEEAPGYERLKKILNELDIEFVDLLPDFREVMRDGDNDLFRGDRHWSPEGHGLAAKVVGSHLLEQNLLTLNDAAQHH